MKQKVTRTHHFCCQKKYLLKIYGKIELSKTINHLPERRYNLMITDKQLTLASSSFRRVPYSTIKCTDLYQIFTTTIYLWLISLTASKELSILLLKLLKCMEQSVYRLIHLGLRVRCRD